MCGGLQGRVACEINSGDELVTTEMIFAGVPAELTPEEAVAVLSALVFQVSCLVCALPVLTGPSAGFLCTVLLCR